MFRRVYLVIFLAIPFAQSLYEESPDLTNLDLSNFEAKAKKGNKNWLVQFYVPESSVCQDFAPLYENVASNVKNVAKIGVVNCEEHQKLCERFTLTDGYPEIFLILKNGMELKYEGERTVEEITQFVLDEVAKIKEEKTSKKSEWSLVTEFDDNNFEKSVIKSGDPWMIQFYAPWCGHCKMLKPEWQQAAQLLENRVRFGSVDAIANKDLASKYLDRGYPTIRYFSSASGPMGTLYVGARDANAITDWVHDKLVSEAPIPKVMQLLDEKTAKNVCEGPVLCIMTILPNILDCQSDCRTNYLEILEKLTKKFKSQKWGWLWSEAGAQPDIEKALELGGSGYPALVAVNWRKLKYSTFKGSFSVEGLKDFLDGISDGRGQTSLIKTQRLPKILPIVPWDHQDLPLNIKEEL